MSKGARKGEHRSVETEWIKGEHISGQTEFKKGHIPWNKGVPATPERKQSMSEARSGKPLPKRRRRVVLTCRRCGKEFEVKLCFKDTRLYCSQECARLRGRNKLIRAGGYLYIYQDGKYIAEQRVIMEQMLGRPLKKGEIVHHKNGDRTDNRKENLLLMSQASHMALNNYLAGLWMQEHPDKSDKVAEDFATTFGRGGRSG